MADLIKHELVVDLHNNSYGFIGDLQFTMKDGGRMHYSIETPFDALYEIISDKDNEKYRYALAYGAVQLIYNDIDNLIKERWKNINDNWLMRHTYATQAVNLSDIVIHRPVRPDPKRIYLKEDLLELGINEVEDIDNIVTDVNYSMEILGIPYQLKVDKIKVVGNVPELYTIAINDLISNTIHNYSDVGYGLSQIIPILFSMKNKKKWDSVESLIIIEQPELHLHPRTQARLVEVFYNNIVSRGDKYAKRNFIIETHSEHLVRGLQVLVAKKNLLPEDIAIYYVDKNTHGDSFVKRMHIDDAGYFKESWPEGFFDQAYRQSVELITSKH